MAEKQCQTCGAAVGKTAKFCKRCGAPLDESPPVRNEGNAVPENETELACFDETVFDDLETEPSAGPGPSAPPASPTGGKEEEPAPVSASANPSLQDVPASGFRIKVLNGLDEGRESVIAQNTTMTVGSSDEADLEIAHDPLVSRRHATLWLEDGQLYVRDENSTNGTLLRIAASKELAAGDILLMGETLLQITREE